MLKAMQRDDNLHIEISVNVYIDHVELSEDEVVCTRVHRFFYKNPFYKNHQAQNRRKIKNLLRIMPRLVLLLLYKKVLK